MHGKRILSRLGAIAFLLPLLLGASMPRARARMTVHVPATPAAAITTVLVQWQGDVIESSFVELDCVGLESGRIRSDGSLGWRSLESHKGGLQGNIQVQREQMKCNADECRFSLSVDADVQGADSAACEVVVAGTLDRKKYRMERTSSCGNEEYRLVGPDISVLRLSEATGPDGSASKPGH